MKARTSAVVGAGGVLRALDCQPPLTLRRVGADEPGTCALCLVGTAAGPLDGDDFELDLVLEAGARATLQATGATLAQGGASSYGTAVTLGAGARLRARPGPLVVSRQAAVDITLALTLAGDAAIDWRETVVLGRSAESAGSAVLRWDVVAGGRPVLRQRVELGRDDWPGARAGQRVLATALVRDPRHVARTVVHGPGAVAARLDEHTTLATVLAGDAASAAGHLDALLAAEGEQR